ncbi:MAG: hypothetical protein E6R13_05760 [Spirochaetes bacterium]|nr:MAG: hypothetical protein E6R13_05760 [Spirochaetota bacterium]
MKTIPRFSQFNVDRLGYVSLRDTLDSIEKKSIKKDKETYVINVFTSQDAKKLDDSILKHRLKNSHLYI